jgi:hypothetical protein
LGTILFHDWFLTQLYIDLRIASSKLLRAYFGQFDEGELSAGAHPGKTKRNGHCCYPLPQPDSSRQQKKRPPIGVTSFQRIFSVNPAAGEPTISMTALLELLFA